MYQFVLRIKHKYMLYRNWIQPIPQKNSIDGDHKLVLAVAYLNKHLHQKQRNIKLTNMSDVFISVSLSVAIVNVFGNSMHSQQYNGANSIMFNWMLLLLLPNVMEHRSLLVVCFTFTKSPSGPPWNKGHRPKVRHETSVLEVPVQEQL